MTDHSERFWRKVAMADGERCWEWQGAFDSMGYGRFWLDRRSAMAHRVAYALAIGPIPEGHVIDHLCRVPLCVRPSHLEAVTPGENLRRGLHRSRGRRSCRRGHIYTEANTRRDAEGYRICRACRAEDARRSYARARRAP